MGKRVIAIGNRLMMDDGVALFVIESIKNVLENKGVEVIIGETDVDFCFFKLNKDDEFYIVDAFLGSESPGTLTFKNLKDMNEIKRQIGIHSLGIIDLINRYSLEVKGYFIGIEIGKISMNIGLSNILQLQFKGICSKVLNFIVVNKY
ncbi:hydrogenase maturation protease [Clostridium sp. P21]|uniref:Hydrogenase maturation protease n=1 Tax=Clostridium muellerianum TaxID=2716538 RepID=A0A7Y0EI00_9CLOT|nr:hydrogenase maturation protease [Clostridium muellerianum]NMM63834.1 hydrogenase maturation protease [Clostridium muellerianum]